MGKLGPKPWIWKRFHWWCTNPAPENASLEARIAALLPGLEVGTLPCDLEMEVPRTGINLEEACF
jgi:hypothetical protein